MKADPKGLWQRYGGILRKLKREILHRKAVEEKLKKRERHYTHLLEKSYRTQEDLRHLSHQVLLVQEEERKEISRELHDEIVQTLTGINVHLARSKRAAAVNTHGFQKKIVNAQRLVEKSVNIIHRFADELRPTLLDDLGLIPALRSYIKEFAKRTHIPVYFSSFSGVERLSAAKRTVLYRVVQSALSNVGQHAHASRVDVRIQRLLRGNVRMAIKDNGKSFQLKRVFFPKNRKQLGLIGMRERVEMVGGVLTIDSAQGKGTTILAEIPFTNGCQGGENE